MAKNTDKNSYTIIFAIIMVLVVGSLLAGVAQGLKSKIDLNERFEKQQNILYAMGVNQNEGEGDVVFVSTDKVEADFNTYIKKQLVIQGDQVTEDKDAYLIDLKQEETKAKDPNYQRRLPLFVGEKDGETTYVIPMRGKGLWDAIWGFVAIDKNYTVQGVFFDHKGETPGLGGEIKQRYFMDDFTGEQIMSNDVFKGIEVAKGNNDPLNTIKDDNEVDAIAGATITGNGITAMIKKDLRMYLPYLETLKK
ncbi:Na(+)-translocating NADH-quinone reductase subunit C [Ulvibacter litoralis]|uniref:Na(+)-translocating NADH-quinone reductase subunit C n=1 Tax=Ulvibacter litoralis TaxID=227084 RepID=A0A1G7GHH5_9FLAO|nr:Na(+)-translocating NADH-quinone reductase subunit C [Ulvibacter litoralis]GHC56185.1 Na(+)-translocating NADH-quinone reductase subunit C [Ulvibacter litoralis]SDE87535.1 Na+-transporting NADH:ubiquinone oxidoreductase subunit C [Ulvibacter litoralis]